MSIVTEHGSRVMPRKWTQALPAAFPADAVLKLLREGFKDIRPSITFAETPVEGITLLLASNIVGRILFESEVATAWLVTQRGPNQAIAHHLRTRLRTLNDLAGWLTLVKSWRPTPKKGGPKPP
jgi:hypothetical protein